MAPNDKRDIQEDRDIQKDVYQDLLEGVVDQKIGMLSGNTTYEYEGNGDPLDEVLDIIGRDKGLKKELAALQKDITAAGGVLSVDVQQRLFLFMQTTLYLIGERDKKIKKEEEKLMFRLEDMSTAYLCFTPRANTVGIPDANVPEGMNGRVARMVLDHVCDTEGFPEDMRAETEQEAALRHDAEVLGMQQGLENKNERQENAETNLEAIDAQINPYLNPELEADKRIIDLQRIILSDHLKKERAELLAGLEVGRFDGKKVDKARKAIRARLKGGLYIKVPGDVAKLGKNVYEGVVTKPTKKPQKTFDLGAKEEKPTFDGTVSTPNKLRDDEVDKAIFTLPQVQSLVALELGRPFLEFMKAREQYVSMMKETALGSDVDGIPAGQWFAQKVRGGDPEYGRGYLATINMLSDMRLSGGAIAVYEDQQKKINALGFSGFVEGKDRKNQPWTEYMLAVNKAVGGRFLLLGSAGEQSYGEYRSIDAATMQPVLGGKTLPTFKQLRQEARERDDFFDLPGGDDTSPLNDLHDDLEEKATGKAQVETDGLGDTRTGARLGTGRRNSEQNLTYGEETQHFQAVGERLDGSPIYDNLEEGNPADQEHVLTGGSQDPRFKPANGIVGVSRTPGAFVQGKPPIVKTQRRTEQEPGVDGEGIGDEEAIPGGENPERERHISKTEAMFNAEEGINDFLTIPVDKKLALRPHLMLDSPGDYVEKITLALRNGELDYACVVFGDFRYSRDESVKVEGKFDSMLEDQQIRRMKNAAKGKKIGVFYLNIRGGGWPQGWISKKQNELGIIASGASISKEAGVSVVLGKDDPEKPKQIWKGDGGVGFIGWASDASSITSEQVEVGKQKDKTPENTWNAVQKETPSDLARSTKHFSVVTDVEGYQAYKNTMKEGEKVLMLWTDTQHPLKDDDLARIVSHYKRQNVRVCYIVAAEKIPNIAKTRIVQLADGSRKMKGPTYVLKTGEKDLYTLKFPYAVTMSMHNSSGGEGTIQMTPMVTHYYTGDISGEARDPLEAVKFTLNQFDLDLAQQRAQKSQPAPK